MLYRGLKSLNKLDKVERLNKAIEVIVLLDPTPLFNPIEAPLPEFSNPSF